MKILLLSIDKLLKKTDGGWLVFYDFDCESFPTVLWCWEKNKIINSLVSVGEVVAKKIFIFYFYFLMRVCYGG